MIKTILKGVFITFLIALKSPALSQDSTILLEEMTKVDSAVMVENPDELATHLANYANTEELIVITFRKEDGLLQMNEILQNREVRDLLRTGYFMRHYFVIIREPIAYIHLTLTP